MAAPAHPSEPAHDNPAHRHNALKHGLTALTVEDAGTRPLVQQLSKLIRGRLPATPEVIRACEDAASAQIQIRKIREYRCETINIAIELPDTYRHLPETEPLRLWKEFAKSGGLKSRDVMLNMGIHFLIKLRVVPHQLHLRQAIAILSVKSTLRRLGRYEAQALSRRRKALQDLARIEQDIFYERA